MLRERTRENRLRLKYITGCERECPVKRRSSLRDRRRRRRPRSLVLSQCRHAILSPFFLSLPAERPKTMKKKKKKTNNTQTHTFPAGISKKSPELLFPRLSRQFGYTALVSVPFKLPDALSYELLKLVLISCKVNANHVKRRKKNNTHVDKSR